MMNTFSGFEDQKEKSTKLPQEENSAQRHNITGYQLLLEGKGFEALSYFRRALDLTPGNPVILNNLGNALFQIGRYAEAQKAYEDAIKGRPDYLRPYRNLGLLHQLRGDNNAAIAAYQKYLSLVPEDGEAWHNLGLLFMTEGRKKEAQVAFETAERYLSPEDAERTTQIGVGHFYRGNMERAVELFEQALEIDETFVLARYHLGLARLYQGSCEEAIVALEDVVSLQPDHPQAAVNLGVAYNTAGQPQKAITIFEGLLQQSPDNPSIHLNLGFACQEAGLNVRAIACFRRVISMIGSDTDYAQKARQALRNLGHPTP